MSKLILQLLTIKGERYGKDDERHWHTAMVYPFACCVLYERAILLDKYFQAYTNYMQNPREISYKIRLDAIGTQIMNTIERAIWVLSRTNLPIADEREMGIFEHMPDDAILYHKPK